MIKPHGGKLVNRILTKRSADEFSQTQKIVINEETIKDVKNIARGVYSPLEGFLCRDDFENVLENTKLTNGVTWPIPIVLDVDKRTREKFKAGEYILLVDKDLNPIAILEIEDIYGYNKGEFAEKVFCTKDKTHTGVDNVFCMGDFLLGGKIDLIDNSKKHFPQFNMEPKETRSLFKEKGWKTTVAFQTRNPPHRGHEYLQKCGLEIADGLFINPVIGRKKAGDFRDEIIMKSYVELIKKYYPKDRAVLGILPMQMRYAGPREAIFHAIIRKNFGCTHFIIGRDHAGVGNFYGPYDAHKIFDKFDDLEITPLKFDNAFYCKRCNSVATIKTCLHDEKHRINPSGTLIRSMIKEGKIIPKEIMRPEVSKILLSLKNPYVG